MMVARLGGHTMASNAHKRHSAAAKTGALRDVFRLNLEFHKTFFEACGNAPLAEAISQFAFKAHATRSYTIGDPKLLLQVCEEHAQTIKLIRGTHRRALITLVSQHKEPAKQAYLQVSRRMEVNMEPEKRALVASARGKPAAKRPGA